MKRRALWLLIAVPTLACGGVSTPPDAPKDATTPPSASLQVPGVPEVGTSPVDDPGAPGPWLAGVRTFEITDPSRSRTLPVDVWYPVDPAQPDGDPNTYELDSFLGTIASIDTPALRDATPAPGPWPVVMFSHGFGGIRFQSYFLTEHLATHGFVVVAPDHPGNTLTDFFQLGDEQATIQSSIDRPLDILFALDWIGGGGPDLPEVDPARVGMTGHSFGGWTAFEAPRQSPDIIATFPMAPGFKGGATPDMVAELKRPVMIFGGSVDGTTPFETDQQAAYDVAADPRYLIEILGAGHLDFSNLCDIPIATLFVDDGCDPTQIDPAEVHTRVNAISTAFAKVYIAGNPGYAPFLETESVTALGKLEYQHSP